VLIPVRLTLERFSFLKALERMDEGDFAELAKEVWLMGEAARADDLMRSVEADIRFHEFVLSRSGQPHTAQLWGAIAPRIRAYFFRFGARSDLARIAREHAELLAAMQTRKSDVLAAALERHIAVQVPPS
jgi:DNA-binding GntR family transcriptional regulator